MTIVAQTSRRTEGFLQVTCTFQGGGNNAMLSYNVGILACADTFGLHLCGAS